MIAQLPNNDIPLRLDVGIAHPSIGFKFTNTKLEVSYYLGIDLLSNSISESKILPRIESPPHDRLWYLATNLTGGVQFNFENMFGTLSYRLSKYKLISEFRGNVINEGELYSGLEASGGIKEIWYGGPGIRLALGFDFSPFIRLTESSIQNVYANIGLTYQFKTSR